MSCSAVLLLNNLGHANTGTIQAPNKHHPQLIFSSLYTIQAPNKHHTTISKKQTILSEYSAVLGFCMVLIACCDDSCRGSSLMNLAPGGNDYNYFLTDIDEIVLDLLHIQIVCV